MERQNEPLAQQKPWEEMTEEERQVVRESWKHSLPEEFDVFCIGDMSLKPKNRILEVPGNLYIRGNFSCARFDYPTVIVKDNFFVEVSIVSGNITVGGNFIVNGHVDTLDISVGKTFNCLGDAHLANLIVHENCFIGGKVSSYNINVNGILDCFDVFFGDSKLQSSDYVCRCYEERRY